MTNTTSFSASKSRYSATSHSSNASGNTLNVSTERDTTTQSASSVPVAEHILHGLGISPALLSTTTSPESSESRTDGRNVRQSPISTSTVQETIFVNVTTLTSALQNSTTITTASNEYSLAANAVSGLHMTSGSICIDMSCALACNSLLYAWSQASTSFSSNYARRYGRLTTAFISTMTGNYLTSSIVYPSGVQGVYTLCDGVPRVNTTYTTSTWLVTSKTTTSTMMTTIAQNFSVSPPRCAIPPGFCLSISLSYSLSNGSEVPAQCGLPGNIFVGSNGSMSTDSEVYDTCIIDGGPVRLLYWPVTTVGGLCAHNGSTIPATPSGQGPNTVTFSGSVLTSPTVYLSFASLFARSTVGSYCNFDCITTRGSMISNVIIPEAPSAISTACMESVGLDTGLGQYIPMDVVPLNYAKLQQPVHKSDYDCAVADITGGFGTTIPGHGTIWNNYNPYLLYPTDIVKVESQWADCAVGTRGNFLFDPPIALTQTNSVARPIAPFQATPTSSEIQVVATLTAQSLSSALPASAPISATLEATITAGSAILFASAAPGSNGTILIGDQTLSVDGSAIITDGLALSLGASGLVQNGSTTSRLQSPRLSTAAPSGTMNIGAAESSSSEMTSSGSRTLRAGCAVQTSCLLTIGFLVMTMLNIII